MAAAHQATLKTLTQFLEEAVTWTSDTRQRLSSCCGEVNHLLHNWNPPQSIKLDMAIQPECSNQNNRIKEAQGAKETCTSSQKIKNKIHNTISGSNACLKPKNGETTDKRNVTGHSQSKVLKTSTGKTQISQRGIQEKDSQTENVLSSVPESKDPLRKKILIKFKQNALVPRSTYQNDYSTLKQTSFPGRLHNGNNINLTTRNSQTKKKTSGSSTSVKCERTRNCINEKCGNRQKENGKLNELSTVDNKLENNKMKPTYFTLEEAVDGFNLSTTSLELIRNFRLHYSFVQNMEEKRDHPAAARNAAASGAFLKLFAELNKARWHKNLSEPLGRLFADTMSLSKKVFHGHSCVSRTDLQEELELKNIYQRMEKQFLRLSNQDNIVHTVDRSRSAQQRAERTTQCQNMGMWYWRQTGIYDDLRRKLYLAYKDEKQWQQLQRNLQLIERLNFQIDISELLLSEMIPQILTMDPNTKNFQIMLKVVWAMTDLTRPSIPIFVMP